MVMNFTLQTLFIPQVQIKLETFLANPAVALIFYKNMYVNTRLKKHNDVFLFFSDDILQQQHEDRCVKKKKKVFSGKTVVVRYNVRYNAYTFMF